MAGAVGVAIITLIMQLYFNLMGNTAFMLGVLMYLGISDILSSMNGVERIRGLRIGVGVFLFTWVTTWALLYTVVQTIG